MNNIKAAVSKNIASLRQSAHMTQLEFAERLNYSDKAVSKWERGEALPDIATLAEIANIFGVTLDYLVAEEHPKEEPAAEIEPKKNNYNRSVITCVSVALVWLIAILIFVILSVSGVTSVYRWLIFVYSMPVSSIVWLVLNSVWMNRRRNYLIISLLMWSIIMGIYLSLLPAGINALSLFLLGGFGQFIIVMWSFIKRPPAVGADENAAENSDEQPEQTAE